jgi:hypothetical protein
VLKKKWRRKKRRKEQIKLKLKKEGCEKDLYLFIYISLEVVLTS